MKIKIFNERIDILDAAKPKDELEIIVLRYPEEEEAKGADNFGFNLFLNGKYMQNFVALKEEVVNFAKGNTDTLVISDLNHKLIIVGHKIEFISFINSRNERLEESIHRPKIKLRMCDCVYWHDFYVEDQEELREKLRAEIKKKRRNKGIIITEIPEKYKEDE